MGDASEYTMQVFRSHGIVSELRKNYQTIASLLEYNRSGTVAFLMANGAIQCGLIQYNFEVGYEGYDNGVKVWSEFKTKINEYVDEMIQSVAAQYREYLNNARITLSDHIHRQYFYKLPRWPRVGGKNVESVELNITGSYRCGYLHIVWSCVGVITVTDTRPYDRTFQAHFTGRPDIKVGFLNYDRMRELENELNQRGIEDAKRFIDSKQRERSGNRLTWSNLR